MSPSIAERIQKQRELVERMKNEENNRLLLLHAEAQRAAAKRLVALLKEELDIDVPLESTYYLNLPPVMAPNGSWIMRGGEFAAVDVDNFKFVLKHGRSDGYGQPPRLSVIVLCQHGHMGNHPYETHPFTPSYWNYTLLEADELRTALRSEGGCSDCVALGIQKSLRDQIVSLLVLSTGVEPRTRVAIVSKLLDDIHDDNVLRSAIAATY